MDLECERTCNSSRLSLQFLFMNFFIGHLNKVFERLKLATHRDFQLFNILKQGKNCKVWCRLVKLPMLLHHRLLGNPYRGKLRVHIFEGWLSHGYFYILFLNNDTRLNLFQLNVHGGILWHLSHVCREPTLAHDLMMRTLWPPILLL